MEEKVLVVSAKRIKPILNGQFNYKNFNKVYEFANENHKFMERSKAEENPNWKQIIPYIVIKNKDNIFLMKRSEKQGEKRLHNKYSIGIGGHINDGDTEYNDAPILSGLRRELDEEVELKGRNWITKPIGTINDESNDVGKVHLGLVYLILTDGDVEVKEKENMTGEWASMETLKEVYDDMETWSQIVYGYLSNLPKLAKL